MSLVSASRAVLPTLAAILTAPILFFAAADDAEGRERPRGDWHRYCKDVDLRGDWLEADCRRYNGNWRRNTRINFDACPGNAVTVRDGYLVCERRSHAGGYGNYHGGWGHGGWDDRWDHDRWDRDRWTHRDGHYQSHGPVVRNGRTYVWNGRQYVLYDRRRHDDRDWRDHDRHDWNRKEADRRDSNHRDWDRRDTRKDNDYRRDTDRRDHDRRRDDDRDEWWKRGAG